MNDQSTTMEQLRELVQRFVAERHWQVFHAPKNLAMSISIEAAELMEHFQWLTVEQSHEVRQRQDVMAEVRDEMADVLCYLLALANTLEIDLSQAVEAKMARNEVKYPAEIYRGRFGDRDPQQ